ncbi:hypothetical protein V474_23440 [Novosphingobium barchaimii LL02]|uniref:Uncharacterized protein n=1 Tax=Novosphingobium barchaimii LL02 TaxID=1114963 RepID=A0A0J7XMQ3_9SPHN|nr:hypothetical protein V474_23440 [Novosphingobium barchaimii LL02]
MRLAAISSQRGGSSLGSIAFHSNASRDARGTV